jgi:hypothetical protein
VLLVYGVVVSGAEVNPAGAVTGAAVAVAGVAGVVGAVTANLLDVVDKK